MIHHINGGMSLSESMAVFPHVFPSMQAALVEAAEKSGNLNEVMSQIVENLEDHQDFMRKIKGAMFYPVILIVLALSMVGGMMIFVIPKVADLYEQSNATLPALPQIVIDISEQRIRLLVNNKVALDSPATTGKRYKRTPKGNFKITEKIVNKRSTIFGKVYRGKKVVYKGDRRKYRGKGKYIGASLKNWMRLTNSGIGIHGSSYIHRIPRSNGCIRVPYKVVSKIFKSVKKGTKVKIVS